MIKRARKTKDKISPQFIARHYARAAKRQAQKVRELRAALANLVRLKDVKDLQGKTLEYKRQMPHAWKLAREVLEKTKGKKALTSAGRKPTIIGEHDPDQHARQW